MIFLFIWLSKIEDGRKIGFQIVQYQFVYIHCIIYRKAYWFSSFFSSISVFSILSSLDFRLDWSLSLELDNKLNDKLNDELDDKLEDELDVKLKLEFVYNFWLAPVFNDSTLISPNFSRNFIKIETEIWSAKARLTYSILEFWGMKN